MRTGARRSARAAESPPNPPPMITTCGKPMHRHFNAANATRRRARPSSPERPAVMFVGLVWMGLLFSQLRAERQLLGSRKGLAAQLDQRRGEKLGVLLAQEAPGQREGFLGGVARQLVDL